MNILFVTDDILHGSSIMRAVWPSLWINKFTEHSSWCLDRHQAGSSAHDALLRKADVVVCHKANPSQRRIAELALKRGKPVVYDTDDLDSEVFDAHYVDYFLHDSFRNHEWMMQAAAAVTVASPALRDVLHGTMIENGFDLTLPQFSQSPQPYFESSDGHWTKMAWGGSSSHARDFAMFYRLGVIDAAMERHRMDVHVYGISRSTGQRHIGNGWLRHHPLHPLGIEWYIADYFQDASFLFAPLVSDRFNDYRSTLKLVEAGVAGKTIIATKTESYAQYLGRDNVVLVENTKEAWLAAIDSLASSPDVARDMGEANRETVKQHYSAKVLTAQRIKLFERIINE
jgi:hypothetical protein